MCREEATDISSLRPQLDKLHIPLYGILHEEKGAEQFKQYLKGDLLFDEKKTFYGPTQSRISLLGLFRIQTYTSGYRAYRRGIHGNMKGDGTLLGSTLVVGRSDQGILYEYHSKEFGDNAADIEKILEAAKKINNA